MAMKRYSTLLRSLEQELYHQMYFGAIPRSHDHLEDSLNSYNKKQSKLRSNTSQNFILAENVSSNNTSNQDNITIFNVRKNMTPSNRECTFKSLI